MICKECRPVRITVPELGVELCPWHRDMEATHEAIEAKYHALRFGLDNAEELQKERRRYGLLQAAAVLQAGPHFSTIESALNDAENILTEIEKREKEGQS